MKDNDFLSASVTTQVNSLRKLRYVIEELHRCQNTIKKNGLYSAKEMALEESNLERENAPQEERDVLNKIWSFRIKGAKLMMKKIDELCKEIDE